LPDGLNVGLASGMGAATVCPAWKQVTIRSLLNMTSGVPNYSETEEIGQIEVADLYHQFTPQRRPRPG
jgi:CubicO group peptidase (beta-lactamase class C family)